MTGYIITSQLITLILSFVYREKSEIEHMKYYIAISSVFTAIIAVIAFIFQIINPTTSSFFLCNFLNVGSCCIPFCLTSDALSISVNCVACLVSSIANIYSIGYMRKNLAGFMYYLNLLPLLMTFFVSSNNLMQTYIFWQLMSVLVYFIISFEQKLESLEKGFKFLAINKIGDAGFIISMAAILRMFNTLSFDDINRFSIQNDTQLEYLEITSVIMMISILVKSMQIGSLSSARNSSMARVPAMAVIQSSTIIASGMIVIIRLQGLFECSEMIQNLMIFFGSISSIVGALMAIFSRNIKRVLAYSSTSQVGLMIVACGFSAYGAAIMLFVTHAFSKALLIFSAGSVIKALSGEHDLDKMGGLLEFLPKTYIAFVIATISMICIPLLPAYYSYKVILREIMSSELSLYYLPLISIVITSIMTCIYLFRLIDSIFHGDIKINEKILAYVNEDENFIIKPIYISMFFAIFSGVIFYYAAYTDIMWKNIFAFTYTTNRSIMLLFSAINFVGIVCAVLLCKSIRMYNFTVPFASFFLKTSNEQQIKISQKLAEYFHKLFLGKKTDE